MADKGLTYAEAGVDIDAGNRMVELIKPLVRATARPGADAEIGGFGGLFDLKRAGFTDPVLVAATDGVGTKLKIAIETGRHDTIGIDLVAMSVNDLVVQGAEPLFFLDYFACGKLAPETGAHDRQGRRRGLPRSRLRADRRRDRRNARALPGRRLRPRRLRGRRRRAQCAAAARGHRRRATSCSASRRPASTPTAIRWRGGWSRSRGLGWDAPAPFDKTPHARRSVADADAHLREIVPRGDARDQGAERRSPTSPAAASPTTFRACCRTAPASRSIWRACRSCRCSSGWPRPAASPSRKCCAPSIAGSA